MDYAQTLEYLYTSLPEFQQIGSGAYKPGLDRARALDEFCGCPHRRYRIVHVAGTNGKGSVAHMTAALLQGAGYKTGLFTSPHIKDFRERIRINGEMIPEERVIAFVERCMPLFDRLHPSFFEMTSAMAFDYFAEENVDFAVIETGLGGRLDSTNIIRPVLSVITNIGLDHTALLGDTKPQIAAEKAGIIKPDTPSSSANRIRKPTAYSCRRQRKTGLPSGSPTKRPPWYGSGSPATAASISYCGQPARRPKTYRLP